MSTIPSNGRLGLKGLRSMLGLAKQAERPQVVDSARKLIANGKLEQSHNIDAATGPLLSDIERSPQPWGAALQTPDPNRPLRVGSKKNPIVIEPHTR